MNLAYYLQGEPALAIGVVDAAIVLAVAFGAPITPTEKVAIDGVISAVTALVSALVIRQMVMPMGRVKAKLKKAKRKQRKPLAPVIDPQDNV